MPFPYNPNVHSRTPNNRDHIICLYISKLYIIILLFTLTLFTCLGEPRDSMRASSKLVVCAKARLCSCASGGSESQETTGSFPSTSAKRPVTSAKQIRMKRTLISLIVIMSCCAHRLRFQATVLMCTEQSAEDIADDDRDGDNDDNNKTIITKADKIMTTPMPTTALIS